MNLSRLYDKEFLYW